MLNRKLSNFNSRTNHSLTVTCYFQKMPKTEQKFTIENLAGIISIIIGVHYYLSYKWLYGLLSIWGIETLSIITFEDLTFPFANLNISVILLSTFGFIGILYWNLVSNKKSKPAKNISEAFMFFKNGFKKKPIWMRWTFVISILILIITYFFIFKPQLDYPNKKLEILYFVILIGIPIIYIFIDNNKRNFVLGFQIFLMFGWANLFVNTILQRTTEKKSNIETHIDFKYKNENITTSDSLKLLFHGHKYLIMSKSNGEIKLYDTKNIDNISINKNSR